MPAQRINFIAESPAGYPALRDQLDGFITVEFQLLDQALRKPQATPILIDIDLAKGTHLPQVKAWLARKPARTKAIFAVDKASHLQQAQASALGATDIVCRPLARSDILKILWGDIASLSGDSDNPAIKNTQAVAAAVDTLQNVFSAASLGETLDTGALDTANQAVVGQVEARGLSAWIDTVRTHHSATYQHCLLVTGLAVAFGQHIGASRADRQRLSCAGMLHDIGKARIPISILEKPGPLDALEMDIMRKHPEYGFKALEGVEDLPREMLDIVIHHHEYLDGSGYPHGLHASEIPDLVRMVTIADIFGALIERRSYRPPMSGAQAYQILLDMGPKLDQDLVRAFRGVAQLNHSQITAAARVSPLIKLPH